MWRQSLRRCAQLRVATAPFLARQTPSLLQSSIRSSQSTLQVTTRLSALSPRWYSAATEAVASEQPAASESEATTPSNPTRFDELAALGVHPNLIKNITHGMGYATMSEVQSQTITPALNGTDLVAQAKTGTGKTLGFLVPVLQRMLQEDPSLATRRARYNARADDIRGIILSPTRELAEQIAVEAEKLVAGTGLVVQRAVGGTQKGDMLRKTRREGCHLLVATPGRLNDLLSDPSSGLSAPNLAAIVLDEADRMLDVGFKRELEEIVDRLPDPRESPRQTLLYSATIPKDVVQLARQWVRPDNFDFIQTINKGDALTHERVKQHIVTCTGWGNVLPAMFEVIGKEIEKANNSNGLPFKTIVFLPSTALVDLAADTYMNSFKNQYRSFGLRIHSKLSQAQRTRAADKFREVKSGILFSSDVTARGMDFPNVTHVIQVGAPPDREQYIHRLGRTGRQDKEGEGWLIMSQVDVPVARDELGGLPIEPNREIESATIDLGLDPADRPDVLNQTMDALKQATRSSLASSYLSLFARVTRNNAEDRAMELRDWFVDGIGLENTPAMSRATAQKLGLSRVRGLNIGHDNFVNDREEREDRGGRSFDRNSGRGGREFGRGGRDFGRGGRDSRRSEDPFSQMSERSFEDRGDRRRGGGGGGGRRDRPRTSF